MEEIAIREIMNSATYFEEENQEEDDSVILDWPKSRNVATRILTTIEEEEEA